MSLSELATTGLSCQYVKPMKSAFLILIQGQYYTPNIYINNTVDIQMFAKSFNISAVNG